MRREIGRPKKLRNKTNDDLGNPHVLPIKVISVICHKFGVMGHNMRSCKGKRVVDKVISKGGNHTKKSKTKKTAITKKTKTNKTAVTKKTKQKYTQTEIYSSS